MEAATKIKKSAIYTKGGDKGETSLFTGARLSKDADYFEALGDVDELNAHIGLAKEYCVQSDNGLNVFLDEIQSRLFDIGSHVATPSSESSSKGFFFAFFLFDFFHTRCFCLIVLPPFPETYVTTVEKWIDDLDSKLPPLTNFILPVLVM